ncbi:MAG: virulence RhuM family protein [Deltaproteobacteria bacterium]|nr:virulence RhuM family protein [Deltaproteobacteria bacterium]
MLIVVLMVFSFNHTFISKSCTEASICQGILHFNCGEYPVGGGGNIYQEGELDSKSTIKQFLIIRREGKRYVLHNLEDYNLNMIISAGCRVKCLIATYFRIWATQRLKEYLIKSFVMDDERLKNPQIKDSNVPYYFDEMVTRIRDIHAVEWRRVFGIKMFLLSRLKPVCMNEPGRPPTTLI